MHQPEVSSNLSGIHSFSFLLLTLINLNLDNACSANPRDGEWALELRLSNTDNKGQDC